MDAEVTTEVLRKHNAVKGAMRVTKTRLKDALDPLKQLRRQARAFYIQETLPGISEDLRLTPSSRLERIRARIEDFKTQDAALVAALVANYPAEIEKDRAALGDRFDASLYPPAELLAQHFTIELFTCDLPSGDYARVNGLTQEAREQMEREHQAMLVQVGTAARNEVMHKLTGLIQTVADKLSNPDEKRFHESTFENLKEYLDQVPELNVTNDPVLEQLRTQALAKLNLSMAQVKESEILKKKAAEDAKAILSTFGGLGKRKLLAAPEPEPATP